MNSFSLRVVVLVSDVVHTIRGIMVCVGWAGLAYTKSLVR